MMMWMLCLISTLCLMQINASPRTLTKDLLDQYDEAYTYARPVINESETAHLRFGVALIMIKTFDTETQLATLQIWLRYIWEDAFLQWDPLDYSGISEIRMPSTKIWTPDIRLYNNYNEDMDTGEALTVVTYDGSVLWVRPATVRVYCPEYAPKEFNCMLKFASWVYDGFKLDLNFYDGLSEMDTSNLIDNGIHILGNGAKRNNKYYPCCIEPYLDLTFNLRIAGGCHIAPSSAVLILFVTISVLLNPWVSDQHM